MNFEENKSVEKYGQKIGYLFAYFLFTTILFFALTFLNKIPESWSYLHLMGITILITISGLTIRRLLK